MTAIFFSTRLEQSWYRFIKGTFVPNYIEISLVVSDKIFLHRYIGENKPCPLAAMFLTNHDGLNNLGTGSPHELFCPIILKSDQRFQTRRFLFFSIWTDVGENKPRLLAAMFFVKSK